MSLKLKDSSSSSSNEEEDSSASSSSLSGDIQKIVEQIRKGLKDRSSQLLQNFKGKVFHLVGDNNKIFRFRIGLDGQITLVRRFTSLNHVTSVEDILKDVPAKAQRRFRAVVTGDPNKRIRDHLKETPQVKMLDKFSFTLGVLIICLTQYIIHRVPWSFPYFFCGLLSFLFLARYISYKQEKYQYFLLDFCYFVNVSTMTQALFFPRNEIWFKLNYVLSLGPILSAIVVWQNSLVFHSMDKVTSFFIHAFAPMQCHLTRWNLIDPSFPPPSSTIDFYSGFINPLLAYLTWQIVYIFLIEASPISSHLARDGDLMTSYRYLSRDRKNPLNALVRSICHKWKIDLPIEKNGDLNPDTFRTKMVFFTAQFGYTILMISYIWVLYSSYFLSCGYILSIFTWGTWNGASYYIEVFSKRYNLKFQVKEREEVVTDESEPDDEDFAEAAEILVNDEDLQSLSEEDEGKIISIKDVKYEPDIVFILSKDEGRKYSLNELRSFYPQLLIDYLIYSNNSNLELTKNVPPFSDINPDESKKDV
ncbi:uncharacterized protein [Lepeophtheirus salmonis]|uniref:uncharacterized protein n=1 Tax=Lepeophtheirus salmonis TaxID=72036 RepID=UPI001AE258C7|nr:glycerophosphocholine acyltransferase 1-like [Lepeophtheirus salmonis]